MADTKGREYKRETVCKALEGFLDRCMELNQIDWDEDDILSYRNITDITVFGSFVNSNKEKVHDLDIHIVWALTDFAKSMDSRERMVLASRLAPYGTNYIISCFWEQEGCARFLKNRSPILSLDSQDDINQLEGRKVKIMENGVILEDNLKMIFKENNYKPKSWK